MLSFARVFKLISLVTACFKVSSFSKHACFESCTQPVNGCVIPQWRVIQCRLQSETLASAIAKQHSGNKLWCESTTNPVPVLRIAASRRFSELTKNWIRSFMVTPHLLWNFHANRPSRFLVILLTKEQRKKETKIQRNKQRNKDINRYIGDGIKNRTYKLRIKKNNKNTC